MKDTKRPRETVSSLNYREAEGTPTATVPELKTLAGAAISGARKTFTTARDNAPLRDNATLESIGGTAVYLASDYGACTTGEIITVDGGYHVLGMMQPENL